MKTIRVHHLLIGIVACCHMGIFTACEENYAPDVPGNGQEAYVNFYHAAEAVIQGAFPDGTSLLENNMVYINDSLENEHFPGRFPQFSRLAMRADGRQYPDDISAGRSLYSGGGEVFWLPLAPRETPHRFIFTSVNKVFLQETDLQLAPRSFTTLYLAESPETESSYTIVNVPVELEGIDGKVKLQVVNLSPDWGAIDAVLMDKDGNETDSALPLNVGFGEYGAYAEIDTAMANKQHQLVVKFRKSGESSFLLSTAIETSSGSNYTLVIKGFVDAATRSVKIGDNQNLMVEVSPNLRVHKRRMY